ncbi:MAG: bifunctional oligoribonuclease/PAP phosphatase NrnA [Desulfobulbaceae bacterium]|nr:bifunctional oligoribonuclease/PAP phosphatase NrnA [Desulfobulbaceae bacterium]
MISAGAKDLKSFRQIVSLLLENERFLLATHEDPDADGIGSMLALGRSLSHAGKDVTLVSQKPITGSLRMLSGSGVIQDKTRIQGRFDAAIALDCAERKRLGDLYEDFKNSRLLINIDHHGTNDYFGDVNLVSPDRSSTGVMVFELIKAAGLPMDEDIAENLFAAILTDTGSFKYSNTDSETFRAAAELVEYGAIPWEISRKVLDGYGLNRLRLLQLVLATLEIFHGGSVAIMMVTREMLEKSGAEEADSERFVDYPRFASNIELSVLIREQEGDNYKFSLRSNDRVDVAKLASRFGGGGHSRAAGFNGNGPIELLKKTFLDEVAMCLGGI